MGGNLRDIFGGEFCQVDYIKEKEEPEPIESQIRTALINAGFTNYPDHFKVDGKMHRFSPSGKKGDDAGWYVFHPGDFPAGVFGDWRSGLKQNWHMNIGRDLTLDEQRIRDRKIKEAAAVREHQEKKERAAAKKQCIKVWNEAKPSPPEHPYLLKKNIKPYLSRVGIDGRLILPVYIGDELSSLQYISSSGDKKFHPKAKVKGGYGIIGTKPVTYLAEGFATAASIFEATGKSCAFSFSAGNLASVALELRPIVIVADNDDSQVGFNKSTEAALPIKARVIMPPETGDANDYVNGGGDLQTLLKVDSKPSLFVSADSFFEDDMDISYLINDLFENDTTGLMFANFGQGKTFLAIAMGMAVLTGTEFAGHLCECDGSVLYLAGEGHGGIKRRVVAAAKHLNVDKDKLKGFGVSRNGTILDRQGINSVIDDGKRIQEEADKPVKLIIIDTLARHMVGNENSTQDGNEFVNAVDEIRNNFPGAVALIIHHSGHAEESKGRTRGASSVPAAMDFIAQSDKGLLKFTKMKEGEIPENIEFKLMPFELGMSKKNEPITTCVVAFGERAEKHKKKTKMTEGETLILDILRKSKKKSMNYEKLRDKVVAEIKKNKPNLQNPRDPFFRGIDKLLEKQIVTEQIGVIVLGKL